MTLRDYLHLKDVAVTKFCREHNFVLSTISQVINFKKKIGLNVAERIEKATSGVVKATKEDWPNLSDVPKRVYYN